MRRFSPLVFLLVSGLGIHAEEEMARRAQPWVSPTEALCTNLIQAIQDRPDLMVMRLEDALVIDEPSAGQIVTAAMDAVRAKPALVQIIVETALKVAPSRSTDVMQAVRSYTPVSRRTVVQTEEVRRAEISESAPLFEIRRAESAHSIESQPIEQIRRAEVPALRAIQSDAEGLESDFAPAPIEEIRRAEVTDMNPSSLSASR